MFIEVMYNSCYGGFQFSVEAMRMYNERTGGSVQDSFWHEQDRHDPVMVQIVREIGQRAGGPFSNIRLHAIPARFADYYNIIEYDGSESVDVRYSEYKVDAAKAVLKDESLAIAERIERAHAILDAADE